MANNQDMNQLATKHKKFMEKVDIFPYRLLKDGIVYDRAHFYRLSSNLYGSFLFAPYDASYETIKEIFYAFILVEEYMKNKMAKLNDYASTDSSKTYGAMKDTLNNMMNDGDYQSIKGEMEAFVASVERIEGNLKHVTENYQRYRGIMEDIKRDRQFTCDQLEDFRRLVGESQALIFEQVVEQVNTLEPARNILKQLDGVPKTQQPTDLKAQLTVLTENQSEVNLKHSLTKFGSAEKNIELSREDLINEQIRLFEKDFYQALDEGFIKRRVRNPAVQDQ
ncbi:hypothetical protein [Rossellomorea marisflavi]|uniref:hypothetical protein n=1 Tax=Rossellomorea marisflavi TaxID=189381 RepID=UPI0034586506